MYFKHLAFLKKQIVIKQLSSGESITEVSFIETETTAAETSETTSQAKTTSCFQEQQALSKILTFILPDILPM